MFFSVTIRANQFQIRQVVVTPVSIFMMHIQNISFLVIAPLALASSFFNKTLYKYSLVLYFILTRTTDFIQTLHSAFVCACPTTGFFVRTCENQGSTYSTGNFFSIRFPITPKTAEYSSLTQLSGPTIYRDTTDRTFCIGISLIFLSHSSSIPLMLLILRMFFTILNNGKKAKNEQFGTLNINHKNIDTNHYL